jgi:hypothetical protein
VILCGCSRQSTNRPGLSEIPHSATTADSRMTDHTSLESRALNAAAGAVVEGDSDSFVVYISGLERWPYNIEGKRVTVTGHLTKEKLIPDPRSNPPSAGAFGL